VRVRVRVRVRARESTDLPLLVVEAREVPPSVASPGGGCHLVRRSAAIRRTAYPEVHDPLKLACVVQLERRSEPIY
jgi:hypothetical protein